MTQSTTTPELKPKSPYRDIALRQLEESKTNPRRNFSKPALQDLTNSIKELGVLEPLLVRPGKTSDSPFEIVSGARRFRAAHEAGLTEVPCRIMTLTDEAVLEIHIVENLQRDDLHPMEEAKGYQALMAAPHRQKAAQIAAKIGKSEKYVYDRIKLLDLIPELQKVFWSGHGGFTAGHAIILARIPADKQRACMDRENGALFTHEHTLWDPLGDDDQERADPVKVISVRELQAWVDTHVRFDTKPDAMLFPETAKALSQLEQKKEKVLPITYEYHVQDDVRDGSRIFGTRSWVRADGQHESKTCAHSEFGLVVAGPRRGDMFQICRDKHSCMVHYGKEIRARLKAEKAKATGDPVTTSSQAAKERRRQEQEAAQEQKKKNQREQWERATPKILKAIAERVRTLPTGVTGVLARILLDEVLPHHRRNKKGVLINLPGQDADAVVRQAAYQVLWKTAENAWWAPKEFPKVAKELGLDLAPILAEFAPKPQPSAKPVAAKPKAVDKKGRV